MEGKVAIVTGAASGIGKAYAEILLENHYKVCLVDFNADLGKKTEQEFKKKFGEDELHFIQCDVTNTEQLEAVFTETISSLGGLDLVINNAGILDESQPVRVIATNITAVIQGCYLGIKYMGTDNGGRGGVIINTASVGGLRLNTCHPCYTATKHAVVGFTRSIGAISPGIHGIRINAMCPAAVDTNMLKSVRNDDHVKYGTNVQERCKEILKQFKDTISPQDVAKAMWTCVNDDTLSGQCMIVGPEGALLAHKIPATYQDVLAMYTQYTA